MAAQVLFLLGTLLCWAGYFLCCRFLFLGIKSLAPGYSSDPARSGRGALVSAAMAVVALTAGGLITKASPVKIPIAWVIMPFVAWAALVSVLMVLVRLVQAFEALSKDEKADRIKAAVVWALAALVFSWAFRADPGAKIRIVTGGIQVAIPILIALVLLAFVTVAAMVFSARAVRTRNAAKIAVTHIALLVGSVLFGLPLAWLVITSFKEDIDMASPNGIVWVPRVQETVPYFSKDHPVFETRYQGTDVQGTIMERRPGGAVRLDVNKPMSMRGMTVDAQPGEYRQVATQAPIVQVSMDGIQAKGMVVEELEDGHKAVEALSPESIKGRREVFAPGDVTPVRRIGLRTQNYPDALDFLPPEAHRGLTYLKNTLVIVVFGMVGTILSSAIVAYAFSRMRFPGRDAMFWLMLSTMMLPGAVTKLPQFMIFKELGWIDTLYPLWVPAFFGSAFNIFMLRQFFRQIPMELEDAAKIDGCGYLRTFWSVMMPQIRPALAVIAIFTFVGTWNNFFDPLIYINSPENMTISYAVQLYSSDRSGEPGLVTAFTTLAMVPVLALFFFAQRYFIEGVTLTGLGGR